MLSVRFLLWWCYEKTAYHIIPGTLGLTSVCKYEPGLLFYIISLIFDLIWYLIIFDIWYHFTLLILFDIIPGTLRLTSPCKYDPGPVFVVVTLLSRRIIHLKEIKSIFPSIKPFYFLQEGSGTCDTDLKKRKKTFSGHGKHFVTERGLANWAH